MTTGDDRVVAVVGACGTIGTDVCRTLAGAGQRVVALDLDGEAAARLARSLTGADHRGIPIDVTDLESIESAAAEIGPPHAVVYAAGIETTCDVIDTDWQTYRRVIDVNLNGAIAVGQAFGRLMVAAGRGGAVVFLSSTAGKRGEAGAAAYCASKFGLLGVTECFAAEVGRHGIRVNAVCPGNVDSPMLRQVAEAEVDRRGDGASVDDVLGQWAEDAAEQRLIKPQEVAGVIAWLCSDSSSGINGESINIDAGALTG